MTRYKIEIEVDLQSDSQAENFADILHDCAVLLGFAPVVRWRRPCELPPCVSVEVAGIPIDLDEIPF